MPPAPPPPLTLDLTGLVTFVDFGIAGNHWLQLCGVSGSPSASQLAQLLLTKHDSWFDPTSAQKIDMYLLALMYLSNHLGSLETSVKKKLKQSKWLLAYKSSDPSERPSRNKTRKPSAPVRPETLCLTAAIVAPQDCFLNDNENFKSCFNPWTAPEQLPAADAALPATMVSTEHGSEPASDSRKLQLLQSMCAHTYSG